MNQQILIKQFAGQTSGVSASSSEDLEHPRGCGQFWRDGGRLQYHVHSLSDAGGKLETGLMRATSNMIGSYGIHMWSYGWVNYVQMLVDDG